MAGATIAAIASVPEPPLRSAFDRARDAAAAIRAHRIAALAPEEKQHYASLERDEKLQQDQRDATRQTSFDERVKENYLRERTKPGALELTPRGAVRSTDSATRKRAEEAVRRQDVNERNAEVKASRARLDGYLADRDRARNERDRGR